MSKTFTKRLFLTILSIYIMDSALAQTITVGAVDPGPYGRGSTITTPVNIDNTTGCISTNNIYSLYLVNSSGVATSIGTFNGFYATFVNGIIPATTPAGTYKLRVMSSSPAITSNDSAPFTINAVGGVVASVASQVLNSSYPEIFGVCIADEANPPASYDFINNSTPGSNVTASFVNEQTHLTESTNQPIPTSFSANFANYSVIVRAEKGGFIGTKSFTLLNNVVNNSFSVSGSTTVCLGGSSQLAYNVIISGPQGIQRNYPGVTYNISWGDGVMENYTFCDIVKAGGKVVHTYVQSSCGRMANGQSNVFKVDLQPVSPYCSNLVTPITSYAKVLTPPKNEFNYPPNACTNTPVTFINSSDPGMDPNNTGLDCRNLNARYTWFVNGVAKATNVNISYKFVYVFPTHGNYTVSLKLQNGVGCTDVDKQQDICIQDPPTPNFTIPATYCIASGPLSPVNTSVVDETCSNTTQYTWTVLSGPAGGMSISANVKTPLFTFSKVGVYKVRLDITTLSCGTVAGPVKEIVVNDVPTVSLSPDANQCGKGVTLNFDPTPGSTQTIMAGTAQSLPATYAWSVTGGSFAFANGTNANSQYPSITFNDYATYTITATHTNNCGGPVSDSQVLTFVSAPTVSAGPPQNSICEGALVNLTGSPGVGGLVNAVKWTSPTGGAFSAQDSPNTTYTPTVTDIANGQVVLTFTATTPLVSPCNQIPSTVVISFIKKATVTSSDNQSTCSGASFNYTITSANPATTFAWTAATTTGTASGFTAIGSGVTINDILVNNTNTDAAVTYTIIPTLNGCAGTPFLLRVIVHPLSVLTQPVPVNAEICSDQPANIPLLSNIAGTTYTWTSVASAPGISGNTNQNVAVPVASIQDILINTSASPGTVTYTITTYNGTCAGAPKQVSIKVNQPVITANAGADQPVCNTPTITLDGNDPLTFGGTWTQVAGPTAGVVIANPSNPKTTVTGLTGGNNYTFRWTINGTFPCANSSDDVDIINRPDVPPGFTQNKISGCGSTTVQFTNTSPSFVGVVYVWDFGDGSPTSNDVNPQHTFEPDALGKDKTYTVTLTTTVNCTARPPYKQEITIHPAVPKPRIFPDKTSGCGPFTLSVENSSLARYKSYTYFLLDENGGVLQQRQTSDPLFNAPFTITPPLNPKIYKVYLRVTDFCDQVGESEKIDIKVSPTDIKSGMFITDYNNKCFPVTVTLHNNSTGGDKFRFTITNTNGDIFPPIDIGLDGVIPYRFTKPGIYYISMQAENNCGPALPTNPNDWRIEVYEKPRPNFTVSTASGGCGNLDVSFNNTTISDAASPPPSLGYSWDFGDGSPIGHEYSGFVHSYTAAGTYTVTLTATNTTTGCFEVITKTDVVTVFAKPVADFAASPGLTTAIPNYRFTFTDATIGKPVQWNWTFGDGQTGTGRTNSHTYGDVGEFLVTLDIIDDKGCTSTISKTVKITGTPGFLYLPNAFMPNGSSAELKDFKAKGSGIAKWQMQIFNNWGQLIWQTTALGSNGEPTEGWDGLFKGQPVQQGTYVWQVSATFINGTEWKGMSFNGSLPKRSGYIHLLR